MRSSQAARGRLSTRTGEVPTTDSWHAPSVKNAISANASPVPFLALTNFPNFILGPPDGAVPPPGVLLTSTTPGDTMPAVD